MSNMGSGVVKPRVLVAPGRLLPIRSAIMGKSARSILRWYERRLTASLQSDDGFTLIELVIVLVILPIVIGGVTVAILTALQDQQGLARELASSAGSQNASAYFVRDVEGASTVTAGGALPVSCGTSVGPSTQIVGLAWNGVGGVPTTVSYEYLAQGKTLAFVRSICTAGSESDNYIAHDLDPSAPPTLTVCFVVGGCQTNPSGSWTSGIATVQIAASFVSSPATFTLTGTPRPWNPPNRGAPPTPDLLVLGTGSGVLNGSGDGDTDVNGLIDVASTQDGSIVLSGKGDLKAKMNNAVYVADPAPLKAAIASGSGSVVPNPTYSAAFPDPYAASPPNKPTIPGTCAVPVGTMTEMCTPGFYSTAPSLTPGDNVDFVAVPNQPFYFSQGIDLSASGDVTGSGVLLYVASGGIAFPTSGKVQLSPDTGSSNPNLLVIWLGSSGAGATVTLTGTGTGHSTYGGIVYAPKGDVTVDGQHVDVAGLVANSVHFAQSGKLTIG